MTPRRTAAHTLCATLLATTAATLTLSACQQQPPARGFTLRYEPPAPAERAAAHLCLLYGAAPERHPDLAARTQGCTPDWPTVRETWTRALTPVLRPPGPGPAGG